MAPTVKHAALNVPKTMTLGPTNRSKKTTRTRAGPKKTTKQSVMPQAYRVVRKPASNDRGVLKHSGRSDTAGAVTHDTSKHETTPSSRSLLAQRIEDLAWQKRELARQDRVRDRRAKQIATRGFFHKGRWIRPEVKEPFVIKVERGSTGTEENPIEIHDEGSSRHIASEDYTSAVAPVRALHDPPHESYSNADHTNEGRRRRGRGPDITTSFDRRYPHIAEMLEDKILDEEDEPGSLCDFVTADEGSDGGDMDLDG